MSVLAINAGAYYQIESLEGARYAHLFDQIARPEELETLDLTAFSVVLIPCRTPAHRMIPHAQKLRHYLEQGGTVVATGESDSHLWLPIPGFTAQPTNFWWWLTPGADLGVRVVRPDHPLFTYLTERDCTYHLHGWFDAPAGADVLVVNEDGKPILYIDEVTTKGRMILTTLDPFYHHGSHFMPATTRFLDGFLPWIRDHYTDHGRKG